MKQQISTPDVRSALAFLSQAIVANGSVFVAGQIHAELDNFLVGGIAQEIGARPL